MNEDIKSAIKSGDLILFLGAGASKTSRDRSGKLLLDGYQLAAQLAKEASLPYSDENLTVVYSAVRNKLQSRLDVFLESCLRHARPSSEYLTIAEFVWRRIYTLNIDDALDTALIKVSNQNVEKFIANDNIKDQDQFFSRLDYIKLNGSIDRLSDGIIFSPAEYAKATARTMPWYEQSASDFLGHPFLFIGTALDEPLLKYHIERYKELHGKQAGISFVITPSATEIQKLDLLNYNIHHVSGTLEDFTTWLKGEFPKPPTMKDVAIANVPQLAAILGNGENKKGYAELFEGVTLVRRSLLVSGGELIQSDQIRNFYKGFYPTWSDILMEVPADLEVLDVVVAAITNIPSSQPLLPIIGPAGSGKSTILMQAALRLSEISGHAVYHLSEPLEDLPGTLKAIEESSPESISSIFVAIDNLDASADDINAAFSIASFPRIKIFGAERENIWSRRASGKLRNLTIQPIFIRDFSEKDAVAILDKIEKYGSWTRLAQLKPKERLNELMVRARKQLLIAMWEATAGRGFEKIVEDDYTSLRSDDERLFMLIVGLATVNRASASEELIKRALISVGLLGQLPSFERNLAGIVLHDHAKFSVRHPVYVHHLIDHVVDPNMMDRATRGLLAAFSQYSSPVIKHITKKEARIYKGIINHNFLRMALKGKKSLIIGLYKSLEKNSSRMAFSGCNMDLLTGTSESIRRR
ncbi:SIR2 family protein [Cupriavidus sp. DL-D2]|uniref:P-loop NTPase n=1 Tax=Cupriavidus sp. DL-D2 TaxID=3144974 RepID=UPI003214F20E